MYDAALGRWHCIDNLAEEYISWSPYQYVMNNPLKFVDPDGNGAIVTINGSQVTVSANLYLYSDGSVSNEQIHGAIQNLGYSSDNGSYNITRISSASYPKTQGGFYQDDIDATVTYNITVSIIDKSKAEQMQGNDDFKANNNFFEVTEDMPGGSNGKGLAGQNIGMLDLKDLGDNVMKNDGSETRGKEIIMEEVWHTIVGENYSPQVVNEITGEIDKTHGSKGKNGICDSETSGGSAVNDEDAAALINASKNTSKPQFVGDKAKRLITKDDL
jgi:hypothetical protein